MQKGRAQVTGGGLIRTVLLCAMVAACILLIATHGFVRALILFMALIVVTVLPKTRAWQIGEKWLVRMTGSRRRAALVALLTLIAVLAVINIYNIAH